MGKDKLTFENALAKLEVISSKIDSGSTGLEESIKLYEEGTGLIRYCEKLLDEAEQKVTLLKTNADGSVGEIEFDGGAQE